MYSAAPTSASVMFRCLTGHTRVPLLLSPGESRSQNTRQVSAAAPAGTGGAPAGGSGGGSVSSSGGAGRGASMGSKRHSSHLLLCRSSSRTAAASGPALPRERPWSLDRWRCRWSPEKRWELQAAQGDPRAPGVSTGGVPACVGSLQHTRRGLQVAVRELWVWRSDATRCAGCAAPCAAAALPSSPPPSSPMRPPACRAGPSCGGCL